jgi:hypothetical protein
MLDAGWLSFQLPHWNSRMMATQVEGSRLNLGSEGELGPRRVAASAVIGRYRALAAHAIVRLGLN